MFVSHLFMCQQLTLHTNDLQKKYSSINLESRQLTALNDGADKNQENVTDKLSERQVINIKLLIA